MFAEQRRQRIVEMLREEGSVRVRALSQAFAVSGPTIRQDLEILEAEGLITRQHGGAFLKTVPQQVEQMTLAHGENMDRKMAIGRKAAAFINNGDSIILDSGSTTTAIAHHIRTRKDLTVITNALNIALILGAEPSFTIHLTGGVFKPPTLSLTGDVAAEYFGKIFVPKLFLATGAVSFEAGLTFPGFADMKVKKAMMKSASEIFLVADSSKIGKISFVHLGGLEAIHHIIIDNGVSDADRERFRAAGVDVIIADPV
ncbi:MAG: DeoR/GlpR family DNA-binding transcription regulator [Azospirillaceae bacterium]|nr:DeoR/GlpR family DNA-binding transcription regulator [Azospirillaceae bacterium]